MGIGSTAIVRAVAPHIALRAIEDADLAALFEWSNDPESLRMAAFADVYDRAAFDARMARLRQSPEIMVRAVTSDGDLVGSIAAFVIEGRTEVAYWIDPGAWGRGIASRALELLVKVVETRPLYGRAASDNLGSLRVLAKAGFVVIGAEVSFANARGSDIEETILRLE